MKIDMNVDHYYQEECASFLKAKDKFGALSNMSHTFGIKIAGYRIPSSEALYQSLRFPDHPDIQQLIIEQKSPMAAKMKAKTYRALYTRKDWDDVRVAIMWEVLWLRYLSNTKAMRMLFDETNDLPIVEHSNRDDFWGCKLVDGVFIGQNVLGKLLTHLRDNDPLEFGVVRGMALKGVDISRQCNDFGF